MRSNVSQAILSRNTNITMHTMIAFFCIVMRRRGYGHKRLQQLLNDYNDVAAEYHQKYQGVTVRDNSGHRVNADETIFLALDKDLKDMGIDLHFFSNLNDHKERSEINADLKRKGDTQ